ncbi:MAG: hypothetical protein OK439_00585 [Thaumarchaeota archaeon]|nr:hypothetical protein [Nitrososphaerota archaeon]
MLTISSEKLSHIPVNVGFDNALDDRSFECLMLGKYESGVFVRLLAILESKGIKVLRSSFDVSQADGNFVATLLVHLKKTDIGMFDLVEKIMESKLVSTVEFSPREKRLFSNYLFPINLVSGKRSILTTADLMIRLESNFRKTLGQRSDSIFYEEGRSYGSQLASLYSKKARSESDMESIQAILEVTKATGWGLSKCELQEDGSVNYSLIDPPSNGNGNVSSLFLVGMMRGLMEQALGHGLKVVDQNYDRVKNTLTLKLAKD